jgi:hypothetical protein
MYGEGFAVARCLAAGNMSMGTLYYWLDGGPRDERGATLLAAIPRRRRIMGKRRKPLAASHTSLVARLTRTAERQALDIEQRLARPDVPSPERERDVRMLASLVQSLRGLAAVSPAEPAGAASDGGAYAADIALFRKEREELWRATEEGVSLMRSLVRAYGDLRKVEAAKASLRQQDRGQAEQSGIEEFRRVVTERIQGFAAAGQAEESTQRVTPEEAKEANKKANKETFKQTEP